MRRRPTSPPGITRRCPTCGRLPLRVLAIHIAAACRLIGISKTTWYKLQTLKLGPPVCQPPRSRPLVRLSALEAWLKRWEKGDDCN